MAGAVPLVRAVAGHQRQLQKLGGILLATRFPGRAGSSGSHGVGCLSW